MKRSSERILTTHVGSLPRPPDLLAMIQAKEEGASFDADAYRQRVASAVAEAVRRQAESGIDIVADGEMGRFGFIPYVNERLAGIEPRKNEGRAGAWADRASIRRSRNITNGSRSSRERPAGRRRRNGSVPAPSPTRGTRDWRATSPT